MRLDLHVHSHVSDGQLAPAEVVRAAAAGGLDVMALADHDTAAGVPEAREEGERLGVRVIPAIEVSTRHGEHELHILGYWIDPAAPSVVQHQVASARRRSVRMERMVEKLRSLGVDVSFDDVLHAAGTETHSLGRPHLARALLAGGHTRYYGEAFALYLADGKPGHVVEAFPTVEEAIRMIHDAGGVAVWAHPPIDLLPLEIARFAAWGMDGIECFRPSLSTEEWGQFEKTARAHGLFPTGGSDWHGPHRARLGDFYLPPEAVRELLERGPATV